MNNPDCVKIIFDQPILSIISISISLLLYFARNKFESNQRIRIDSVLANLKAEQDKNLAELKSKIDIRTQRAQLVDKTQFMHEYELYKEAWALIHNLNKKINNFERVFPMDSNRGSMEPLIAEANESYEKYNEHLEKHKPFYPEKVIQALYAIGENMDESITNYTTNENNRKEYNAIRLKNRDQLKQCIEDGVIAIRDRISEVRVI